MAYQAPEVLYRTSDEYTLAVDIWALGSLLFKISTKETHLHDQAKLQGYTEKPGPILATIRQKLNEAQVKTEFHEVIIKVLAV